jgi:hypothetical protein
VLPVSSTRPDEREHKARHTSPHPHELQPTNQSRQVRLFVRRINASWIFLSQAAKETGTGGGSHATMVALLFPQAKKIAHEIQSQLEQLDRGVDVAVVQRQAQSNLSQLEEYIAALEKKVNYESAQKREIWRK